MSEEKKKKYLSGVSFGLRIPPCLGLKQIGTSIPYIFVYPRGTHPPRLRFPSAARPSSACTLVVPTPCQCRYTLVLEDSICDEPDGMTPAEVAGMWIGIVTGVISIIVAMWKGYQWCQGKR